MTAPRENKLNSFFKKQFYPISTPHILRRAADPAAFGSYKSQIRGGSKLSCQRARELIHPYIDGELDLTQAAKIEQHIDECEACKLSYHNQLTLHSTFKDNSLYYRAPEALKKRIRSLLSFLKQPQ